MFNTLSILKCEIVKLKPKDDERWKTHGAFKLRHRCHDITWFPVGFNRGATEHFGAKSDDPKKGLTTFLNIWKYLTNSILFSDFHFPTQGFANGQFCSANELLGSASKRPCGSLAVGKEPSYRQIWCRSLQGLLFGENGMSFAWRSYAKAKRERSAVLRGSFSNQDGRSNGLTAPNPMSQAALLTSAWMDAGRAFDCLHTLALLLGLRSAAVKEFKVLNVSY